MSEENMSDGYEVGYGKPPRSTQFQKGVSGNPKGRPKKGLDFDHELLRQSRASITLNENGNRRRVSKHEAAILQLLNKAISGNLPALRTYFDRYQIASEKVALLQAAQAKEAERRSDMKNWTDEEIHERIIYLQKEQETKMEHVSNAD
ncbi:MAG: hypothetical protein QOJ42_8160 [Acidobacteriaceae bacterium]|jgi:hypothetical protein|nr:hypothetical protein [Acidobacteriaceae bacterium]